MEERHEKKDEIMKPLQIQRTFEIQGNIGGRMSGHHLR